MSDALRIVIDDLSDMQVIALLEEHLADMRSQSPACSVHALDIEKLKGPKVTFYTAWKDKELRGCGALQELDATHAELKSMRTVRNARRTGVSSKMLEHLMDESRRRGYQRLSLETGSQPGFLPARKFYEHHGFTVTEPFADYTHDPNSVYYTIQLDSTT
jgi:putative acetyltransferase